MDVQPVMAVSVASTAGVWLGCHGSSTSLFEQMVAQKVIYVTVIAVVPCASVCPAEVGLFFHHESVQLFVGIGLSSEAGYLSVLQSLQLSSLSFVEVVFFFLQHLLSPISRYPSSQFTLPLFHCLSSVGLLSFSPSIHHEQAWHKLFVSTCHVSQFKLVNGL